MKKINIAIDGPGSAGKSTISKRVANALGYVHLDTGAMYRSTAYKAKLLGISWDDSTSLAQMLETTSIVLTIDGRVLVDGKDVSKEIRSSDISLGASSVSKHEQVRKLLVLRQQELAKEKGFVMDGRDIGTVVLTDAELKIYQTASVDTRAQRRYKENIEKGIACNLEDIKKDLIERDYQDMHREVSPLRKAEDAIELDTSNLTIEEATNAILETVQKIVKE